MTTRKLRFSFKGLAKRAAVLLLGIVMMFGFAPLKALANPTLETESTTQPLIALAASSRFAAQAENEGQKARIPESRLNEMREERREWQSEASATAAAEAAAEAEKSEDSVGEAVKDRLNLEEITEENEILN